MNRAICLKFGTEIGDGPSCEKTLKRPLNGRGRGYVTKFRNFRTPYNFRRNQVIRFKFGTEMEDWPRLCTDHKNLKWAWPRSRDPIWKLWDSLIIFDRIELSDSDLVCK